MIVGASPMVQLTADLVDLLVGVFHELVPLSLVGLDHAERLGGWLLRLGLLGFDLVHGDGDRSA